MFYWTFEKPSRKENVILLGKTENPQQTYENRQTRRVSCIVWSWTTMQINNHPVHVLNNVSTCADGENESRNTPVYTPKRKLGG